VRVVLERDLVQTRTIAPAPPLKRHAVRRYLALEAARLFRKNGVPLVTDGTVLSADRSSCALWSAAAPEPVLQAILDGCEQAGIAVERIGPAADVLPQATETPKTRELVFSNGRTAEVLSVGPAGTWRSRLVAKGDAGTSPLVPALAALGDEATHFAAAYGAVVASTRLSLLPPHAQATRALAARRQLMRLGALAAVLWLVALVAYGVRLAAASKSAQRELESHRAALDSALALRRELDAGVSALSEFANLRAARSRRLTLMAAVTAVLDDSVYLATMQVGLDGTVRLTGYAPSAVRAVASIGRVRFLRDVHLDGSAVRERAPSGRDLDRFAIIALERSP
jgi:hypothetical protein